MRVDIGKAPCAALRGYEGSAGSAGCDGCEPSAAALVETASPNPARRAGQYGQKTGSGISPRPVAYSTHFVRDTIRRGFTKATTLPVFAPQGNDQSAPWNRARI